VSERLGGAGFAAASVPELGTAQVSKTAVVNPMIWADIMAYRRPVDASNPNGFMTISL
jgi:hypothetical protein